mmetsp:Transcript_18475/g.44486  ORF Transcript_18475/g.44486 Transcript_18475/m.44486 type:complete len:93 (-) Transcript_18475:456-734(-)
MLQEYENRKARRDAVYEQSGHNGHKVKRAPKHNDRKLTLVMAGEQALKSSVMYKPKALTERIPASILAENSWITIKYGRIKTILMTWRRSTP